MHNRPQKTVKRNSTIRYLTIQFVFLSVGCNSNTTSDIADTAENIDSSDSDTLGNSDSDSSGDSESDTDDEIDTGGGFVCVPTMNELGKIEIANPIVSLGSAVFTSDSVLDAAKLTDGLYHSGTGTNFGKPTSDTPAWVSIKMDGSYSKLLLTWADSGWNDYNNPNGGSPSEYHISTSTDSTDGEDGTWNVVVEVSENKVRTRTHSFEFENCSWVRMTFFAGQDGRSVTIDEIALYDISETGDERPRDSWFFMGDSITKMAFERSGSLNPFDVALSKLVTGYSPAWIAGGIGKESTAEAVLHIEEWLSLNPDASHIGLAYGTNDAWGNKRVTSTNFEKNMRTLVETLLEAGRVPHLASIPYSDSGVHNTLPEFNAVLETLIEEYNLPCGPDLYTFFKKNPTLLSSDSVHPSSAGLVEINRLWAESVAPLYTVK